MDVSPFQIRILCKGTELPSSPIALQVLKPTSSEGLTSDRANKNSNNYYEENDDDDDMDYYPPPDIGQVSFSGLSEPCSIGSIVEVVVSGFFSLFANLDVISRGVHFQMG